LSLLKCGLTPPKSVIFGINLHKRGILSEAIFIKFGLGRDFQARTLVPNFTIVTFKMWAYTPKSPKLIIFGINLPQKGIPLKRFLQYLAWGRESQVRALIPNFTILALKNVGLQPLKSRKIAIFGMNLPLWLNFGGPQKQLNKRKTFLYAMKP